MRQFIDRGVESLVAGEPTPQFATNLRRRIALESEPLRSRRMAWAPIIAGALALTAVLATMVARVPRPSAANPSSASNLKSGPAPAETVTATAASPQIVKRAENVHDPAHSVRARAATTALPEIIVPQGQLAAAAQLSAAINSGRVDGNQLLAAQQDYEKPLEAKPVEIAPLEIPALDDAMETPAGSIQF
jgi:hypothetical protein